MLQHGRLLPEDRHFASVHPPESFLYRVARGPDPFYPFRGSSEVPDNRFDDPGALPDPTGRRSLVAPEERFDVLYCATQRACAFGETIARFRPSVETIARLEEIEDDDPIDPGLLSSSVPMDWRFKRRIGWIQLERSLSFVDLHHVSTISSLRASLAPLLEYFSMSDLDLSNLTSQDRRLTQEVSRFIYEQRNDSGAPRFAGIRYISRLHQDWECWAVFFDRMSVVSQHIGTIFPDDPGFLEAANLLGIEPPAAF